MFSKWQWILTQLSRTLWVRASLFVLLAIVVALIAIPAQRLMSDEFTSNIGADSVSNILNILASSMLAVTTFSLSVMVTAYGSASSGATPRATQLVKQDTTTQNVLATFIGSFLFSLVGIIALSTNLYSEGGRFLLFIATMFVIAVIIITMLRWIQHLSRFGRLEETTQRVENATQHAISKRIKHPYLGGKKLLEQHETVPDDAEPLYSETVGYIQHVDIAALHETTAQFEGQLALLGLPGSFVHPSKPLAWTKGEMSKEQHRSLLSAFTISACRSFDQDPRFGMSVLAEIASRALSPAVNDPGTAIDILSRSVRILAPWAEQSTEKADLRYPNLFIPTIEVADLFDDIFHPIARDGAGLFEVQIRLQKTLLALAKISPEKFGDQAKRYSEIASQYAMPKILIESQQKRLNSIQQLIYND